MDGFTEGISDWFSQLHDGVFGAIPKIVQDGGVVALLAIVLVAAAVFLYNAVVDKLGKRVKAWLSLDKRLVVVGVAGATIAICAVKGWWYATAATFVLAVLQVFGSQRLRSLLRKKIWLGVQAAAVLLMLICEGYGQSAQNASRRYLVLLAFDVGAGGTDETLWRLSQLYLEAHSSVFHDLDSFRVVPTQYAGWQEEHLTSRRSAFSKLPQYVSEKIGRSRFCPALLVTSTVDLKNYPQIKIYSEIRGVPLDHYDRTMLASIRLDGDNIQFLGLKSAVWLMSEFHQLRCDTELHVGIGGNQNPELMLSAHEEQKALRETLIEYKHWVVADSGEPSQLTTDLDSLIQRPAITSTDVNRLLERFIHAPVSEEQARKTRCTPVVKLGGACQDHS